MEQLQKRIDHPWKRLEKSIHQPETPAKNQSITRGKPTKNPSITQRTKNHIFCLIYMVHKYVWRGWGDFFIFYFITISELKFVMLRKVLREIPWHEEIYHRHFDLWFHKPAKETPIKRCVECLKTFKKFPQWMHSEN